MLWPNQIVSVRPLDLTPLCFVLFYTVLMLLLLISGGYSVCIPLHLQSISTLAVHDHDPLLV